MLQRVVVVRPDVPDAQNNLGVAYQALGRWEPAARAFQKAIEADSEYVQALFNLGALLEDRQLYADAEKCFRHAHTLQPDDVSLRTHLADVLKAQQKWAEAEECYRWLHEQDADNLDILVNLGFVLARQERIDEAVEINRSILERQPDYAEIHNNLSFLFERQGKLDEAVESAQLALKARPEFAEGYNNLGTALCSLKRLDDACDCFRKAMSLRPGFALAEFNYGTTKLLSGDCPAGWPGYQRHADVDETAKRTFIEPLWNGEDISGKKLLVYADQGFGDTIQFVRFLTQIKQRTGATLILECPVELGSLLSDQTAADVLVVEGTPLPEFDLQVPLANLPALLDVTLESLDTSPSYLQAPATLSYDLDELLQRADASAMKVGLVWQGNRQQARDIVRSCPAENLLPLLDVPGVQFISLQKTEDSQEQPDALTSNDAILDGGSKLNDFRDTAALLSRLDLIITVDTAASHLAGALGRPVWTLLAHAADWRWHLDRSDSPWYPSMRLFRQPEWGAWDQLVAEVAAELRTLSDSHRGGSAANS